MLIRQCLAVLTTIVLAFNNLVDASEPAAEATTAWAQFRGPGGNGISPSATHPVEWAEDKNVAWKVAVEGVAWSQPIIWGDQILLTTAVTDKQPKPRKGEFGPGFRLFTREGISRSLYGGDPPNRTYQWKLICLDLSSGQRRWERLVRKAKPTIPTHRSNSYASETLVTDGEHVYVHIAMAGIYCFDMDGRESWNVPLDAYPMQYGWGTGSSPLLDGESLYLLCDNEEQSYLVALDKTNGRQRWRVEREELSNWATPYLWRNKERNELVTCGGRQTRAYDPATGKLLWKLDASGRCATTAVGDKDMLCVGSVTRSMGRTGDLTAVLAGASGNLSSEDDGDVSHELIAWSHQRAAPQLSSPLLYQGYVYTLRQQGGIISCYDAATGKRLYHERLPNAGGFTASPWAAGDHVFCLDEDGNTFAIKTGPEFNVEAVSKLDGMFWSSAAIVEDALLLRSTEHLYCISEN